MSVGREFFREEPGSLSAREAIEVSPAVSFVRQRGKRDHIYVTRPDGTSCEWAFPTYGDRLPHDLCHLVVEEMLEIANGFWGLVEQGTEARIIDDQGALMKDGQLLSSHPNFDFSDLIRAEEAVALIAPIGMHVDQAGALAIASRTTERFATAMHPVGSDLGFSLPAVASEDVVASIRGRLHEIGKTWRDLDDGAAITMTFARASV